MEWFAKSTRAMRDPDYLRLPADLRGHHDALLALLAERERGPVLHGAKLWNRRDWDVAARTTIGSIARLIVAGMAEWRGDDLHVHGYDLDGERRVLDARANGTKGATARWSAKGGGSTPDPTPLLPPTQAGWVGVPPGERRESASGRGEAQDGALRAESLQFGRSDPTGGASRGGNRVPDARDETVRDERDKSESRALALVPLTPAWMPDFESLYRAYPLKKGKDKGIASAKRQIRTPADFEALRIAIEHYAAEVRGGDPKYTKHFSTFMGCWRDYVDAPATPPTHLTADLRANARAALELGLHVDAEGTGR